MGGEDAQELWGDIAEPPTGDYQLIAMTPARKSGEAH